MDYMSDFPAPPPETRKKNLIEDLKKKSDKNTRLFKLYKSLNNYKIDLMDNICGINGENSPHFISPGSASGYCIFTRKEILQKFNEIMYDKVSLLNSKDKLQIALIVYNNKKAKKDSGLSFDIIEKIGLKLNS